MEDTSRQPLQRYALVSSLYGPGTTACWYLTILSVLVSWTLHPRKRNSGSIDVDMIAILTLPTVAAGHLISQVSMLMHRRDNFPGLDTDVDQYAQSIAAIEAPFSVIESFMAISVVLFLTAIWMFCLRRALSVALVGLLCVATECYIHFSSFEELGIRYKPLDPRGDNEPAFSRSFVADFTSLIIAIPIMIAVCVATASTIVTYMLRSQRTREEIGRAEQGAMGSSRSTAEGHPPHALGVRAGPTQSREMATRVEEWIRDDEESKRVARRSAWISMVFLPITSLLTLLPSAGNAVQFSYTVLTGRPTTTWLRLKIFAAHFYPHSANSFSDLDQAVATAAGATVLGFSIYSVAKTRYEMQSGEQAARVVEGGVELDRLDQHRRVSGLDNISGLPAQDERSAEPE